MTTSTASPARIESLARQNQRALRGDAKFRCPACGKGAMAVSDSRAVGTDSPTVIRRRRTCLACGHRITTHETVIGAPPPKVDAAWERHARVVQQTLDHLRRDLGLEPETEDPQ